MENPATKPDRDARAKPRWSTRASAFAVAPSRLGAAARVTAVDAFIAGPAANHDRPACRAWRSIFLILNRRKRRGSCCRLARVHGYFVGHGSRRCGAILDFAAVHASVELGLGRQ